MYEVPLINYALLCEKRMEMELERMGKEWAKKPHGRLGLSLRSSSRNHKPFFSRIFKAKKKSQIPCCCYASEWYQEKPC